MGFFLRKLKSLSGQLNPDSEWAKLAPKFDSKFQVPTLRNVDRRPMPEFVKAYMHSWSRPSNEKDSAISPNDSR
jgi:cytochrome c peroxidase